MEVSQIWGTFQGSLQESYRGMQSLGFRGLGFTPCKVKSLACLGSQALCTPLLAHRRCWGDCRELSRL